MSPTRKRAEEQLNVQASALTAAANAIVITDWRGQVEWVNPAFTKLTGYTAEEAIGGNPRMLKSNQHPPAFYANLWATILTGNVWHGDHVNRRKDGQHYTEDMTITPVQGADGRSRISSRSNKMSPTAGLRETVAAGAKNGSDRHAGRRHRA